MNDNQWLIMTYYCPTYGSENRCEVIELTGKDLINAKNDLKKKQDLRNLT